MSKSITNGNLAQIIPCDVPIIAEYELNDGIYEEDIFFIGLDEAGKAHGLTLIDGNLCECGWYAVLKGCVIKMIPGEKQMERCGRERIANK